MQSDAIALVTMGIWRRPLCVPCIASTASTDEANADAALTTIARTMQIRWHQNARCHGCGEVGRVFSLDAPMR